MPNQVEIIEVKSIEPYINELSNLLVKVVEDGASIGFLPPLKIEDAKNYWQTVLEPNVILYVAIINKQVVGSIQLHLCTKQNGIHRAEIAKLMTHPHFRRNGVGRSLMELAMDRAKLESRSLLVLDTREGDPSNLLYQYLGFMESGKIPNYALSANGELHATVLYHKFLS